MAHDRDRADQLSLPETWDAIVRGEHPPAAGQPAGRIELLRLIQAHGDLPTPVAARDRARRRLERALTQGTGETPTIATALPLAPRSAVLDRNGHRPVVQSASVPRTRVAAPTPRWLDSVRSSADIALLLAGVLLILGIGYVFFGSGLRDDDRPKTVPAAVAPTVTPTPDVRSEGTVVEVTIPADVLPAGIAGADLAHLTLLPGTTSTWTVPQNAMLNAILEGRLVVRSGSPMQVLRASGDGNWESVPGSAEVSLGPGDLALLLTMTTADFHNPGNVPVELVQWSLAAGNSATGPMPTTWVLHNYDLSDGPGGVTLTGGPAVLRLQRRVLAPDDTIPTAPEGVQQFAIAMPDNGAGTPVASSFLMTVTGGSGKTYNNGAYPILVYVATLTFVVPDASPPAGTPPP